MPLQGDSNYAKAIDALEQAWEVISEPSGQADEAHGNSVPWAATATAIGIGHALLALCDELPSRG